MSLRLITPPSHGSDIWVEDVKSHLRIDNDDENIVIVGFIEAANRQAELRLCRTLLTSTWRLKLDSFPAGKIRLERPPIQEVQSVKYLDANGTLQTMDPADYLVDIDSEPGTVEPAYNKCWPSTRCQTNAVTIDFVAGYGDGYNVIPPTIRNWILLAIGDLYCNRELSPDKALANFHLADSLLTAESWGGYP